MLKEALKDSIKDIPISLSSGRLSKEVIDIVFDYVMYHMMKNVYGSSLIGHSNIFKIERHDLITISPPRGGESNLVLII